MHCGCSARLSMLTSTDTAGLTCISWVFGTSEASFCTRWVTTGIDRAFRWVVSKCCSWNQVVLYRLSNTSTPAPNIRVKKKAWQQVSLAKNSRLVALFALLSPCRKGDDVARQVSFTETLYLATACSLRYDENVDSKCYKTSAKLKICWWSWS